jgi:hypothetical protein
VQELEAVGGRQQSKVSEGWQDTRWPKVGETQGGRRLARHKVAEGHQQSGVAEGHLPSAGGRRKGAKHFLHLVGFIT